MAEVRDQRVEKGSAGSSRPSSVLPSPFYVLGVPVLPLESYDHAISCLGGFIERRQKCWCVAINPEKVYRAQGDKGLADLLSSAEFGICDGIGVAVAAWLRYRRLIPRITGVDLFARIAGAAAEKNWRVFILGAKEETNAAACSQLLSRYPRLRIVGRYHGYFDDDQTMCGRINESGAEIVFVAMGSPRQEQWIARNRGRLNACVCMGIGGTLDVLSGKSKRAPSVFRKTGTEFLHRLLREPWRARRQLVLPVFALMAVREALVGARVSVK